MGETLFSFDRNSFHDCQARFRGEGEQEYYSGDCWIEGGGELHVRSERKRIGAVSVIRQRSTTDLFFRRTPQHIRSDATDISILWFVKHGEIRLSDQSGSVTVESNGIAFTRSMAPFFMECRVDGNSFSEVLHATIPTHILRGKTRCNLNTGFFTLHRSAELTFAEKILTRVFEDEGKLRDASARSLIDAVVSLAGAAANAAGGGPCRVSITEHRQQQLLHLIDLHLYDPDLSATMLSDACGISRRHLSGLMRSMGTTFSRLIWTRRLDRASTLLVSGGTKRASVAEVAYQVGFKSPEHFSRMFKRAFSVSPGAYRDARGEGGRCQAPSRSRIQRGPSSNIQFFA